MKDRIVDPKYGKGTISKVEKSDVGYWVYVLFDDGTEKKFLSFANPLEKREDELKALQRYCFRQDFS